MIKEYIVKMSERLIEGNVISIDDIDEYKYGIEVFLLKVIHILSMVAVGYIFNSLFETLVFLIVFVRVREMIGGYHSKNPILCFIISNLMIFTLLFIIEKLHISSYLIMIIIISMISVILFYGNICKKILVIFIIIIIISLIAILLNEINILISIMTALFFSTTLRVIKFGANGSNERTIY